IMEPIRKYYLLRPFRKKGNNTWYVQIKAGANPIERRSLKTTSKKEAQARIKKLEHSEYADTHIKELAEAIKEQYSHLESMYKDSPNTLQKYNLYLKKTKLFFHGKKYIHDVEKNDVQLFIDYLAKKICAKSVHEVFKFIRRVFKKWKNYKYISENPFDFEELQLPKIKNKEKPFWDLEELEFILEKLATEECKAFWGVMCLTGLRLNEARFLEFSNVDFETKTIRISGKGNKLAQIPINSYLLRLLNEQKEKYKSGKIFPEIPTTAVGCQKQLKRLLKETTFKITGPINPHRFRHSLASNLLRKGTNINAVQRIMRHSNIKTTVEIYGHLMPGDLHKGVEAIAFNKESSSG
ncbi:MAG: site-specific integrase, partial [bacterium]